VACGAGCEGLVPFAETLSSVPASTWQVVGVPLKCFSKAGADVSKVNEALVLKSAGKLDVAFSQVRLGTVADKVVSCN
jgi:beta-glucosidase